MSISVQITNNDSRPKAIIIVKTVDAKTLEHVSGTVDMLLIGGDTIEKLIHGGTKLIVEEIQNG